MGTASPKQQKPRAGWTCTSGQVEYLCGSLRHVTRLTANGTAAESPTRGCSLSPSHSTSREENDSPQHTAKKKVSEPATLPETGGLVPSAAVKASYDTVSPVLITGDNEVITSTNPGQWQPTTGKCESGSGNSGYLQGLTSRYLFRFLFLGSFATLHGKSLASCRISYKKKIKSSLLESTPDI